MSEQATGRGHWNRAELGPIYARALLAELGWKPGAIREMAAALKLDLREVEADGFDGALIRARGMPLGAIAVRASIREAGRKNFTIAHEIGHFVLPGHEHASIACTAADVGEWADPSAGRAFEREANEFAAEILMPAASVKAAVKGWTPSLDAMEKIVHEFGVSLSAAAWRYCEVSEERCAVVWSTEGMVRWVKRSAGFPFFVAKDSPVEEGTFAAACFAGEKVPGRPRTVAADLWVTGPEVDPSVRLLEQSKALPAYRSVISLLWVKEAAPQRAR